MDNRNISLLIGAFVALIVGFGLLVEISATEQAFVTKPYASNETITLTRNASSTQINTTVVKSLALNTYVDESACQIENLRVLAPNSTVLVANTDYVFTSTAGTLRFLNTQAVQNLTADDANYTTVYYQYCLADYLKESWQRSILNLVIGFFALGALFISIALFYQVLKNEGIVNI